LITRYALAYPNVRFKVTDGKQVILQTAGDGDRRAILAALYGVDVAKQMLEVMAQEDGFSLSGFISPTSLTRSNRKEITFFVNGRWVQEISLNSALLQAYHTLFPPKQKYASKARTGSLVLYNVPRARHSWPIRLFIPCLHNYGAHAHQWNHSQPVKLASIGRSHMTRI
jgi:hypothetical protein